MYVNHKCKSPFPQKPRHGAQGGVLRHPPLCSVFTILFSFILLTFMIPTKAYAAGSNFNLIQYPCYIDGTYVTGCTENNNQMYICVLNAQSNPVTYTLYIIVQKDVYYNSNNNTLTGKFKAADVRIENNIITHLHTYASTYNSIPYSPVALWFNSNTYNYFEFHDLPPIATPTPTPTPIPDYYNGFGNQDTPKGLKGWLKDLWWFLTDPEDYGTVQVGEGDTLVYSTPTPQPSPTPYVQQQQVIDPITGEVIYNIETNIENSTSQVYPTDYVWIDDVPSSVPHEFDLNFSVSGTPIEYTTDLNFSETSDAFIDTVSGVSDGVNALGSLLGAMPIEIIIYPIVAFCIWAIFAFIHRLLG